MDRKQRLIKGGYLICQIGQIKIFGLYSKKAHSKVKKFLHYVPVKIML